MLANLGLIVLALGLMGQARNCTDINTIFSQIDKMLGAGGGSGKIYLSNVSFMDAATKTTMGVGPDAEMLNDAVLEGMNALASQDAKYVVNGASHSLPNTDGNAQKLNQIFWDQNMTKNERVERIIKELMEPANIDGLVSGQFLERSDGTINLRPFVIAKSSKAIVTESRNFTKQEFTCTDQQNPGKKILCQKTREDIRDVVMRLIKQL